MLKKLGFAAVGFALAAVPAFASVGGVTVANFSTLVNNVKAISVATGSSHHSGGGSASALNDVESVVNTNNLSGFGVMVSNMSGLTNNVVAVAKSSGHGSASSGNVVLSTVNTTTVNGFSF